MGDNYMDEREKLVLSWSKHMKKATDFDLWGQQLEAIDEYQSLAKQLRVHERESDEFTDEQKKIIGKVAACLELRSTILQQQGLIDGLTLDDLKKVEKTLKNVWSCTSREFPVNVLAAEARIGSQSPRSMQNEKVHLNIDEQNTDDQRDLRIGGTLLPRPIPIEGKTFLYIRIEKIGLKDAHNYIDSFITISVKDMEGVDITVCQDTAVAVKKEDNYIIFGADVYLQKPLEYLPQGYAVFFEFKHYKPKKKVTSTKCWTFFEQDEIKEGLLNLELYKKPTDKKRKKINLLTVKPLFLTLKLSVNS